MKQPEVADRYQKLLRCVTHLPHQIIKLHGVDNVAEYVLHSLCDSGCMNVNKAAYFIDNPDFHCLKGIAGFSRGDDIHTCEQVLGKNNELKEHIDTCRFNKTVRDISMSHAQRIEASQEQVVDHLAGILGIQNPLFHTWNIKHDNFGLLIFEPAANEDHVIEQDFLNALSILAFCPS